MARSLNSKRQIILIAHNIRSTHNVGSLFRTLEGLGALKLILSGYSPYPREAGDKRLEHVIAKLEKQIHKTALGAEDNLSWQHIDDIGIELSKLRGLGFHIYGLEQHTRAENIADVKPVSKSVIIVGNEITGLEQEVIDLCDEMIEIPMFGKKESFNVVQAAAMALFYFRFSKP